MESQQRLRQLATRMGSQYAAPEVVEGAYQSMAQRAERALEERDVDQLAAALNQFVRGLRGVPVARAVELERILLSAVGAAPPRRRTLEVKGAISVIALRNYARYLAVYTGLEWGEGMLVQSALSDLAQSVPPGGRGEFTFELEARRIACTVLIEDPAAALDTDLLCAGVGRIGQSVLARRELGAITLSFHIVRPAAHSIPVSRRSELS